MAKSKSVSALRKDRDAQKLKLCMCMVGALAEGSLDLDNEESLSESDRRELIVIADSFVTHVRKIFWSDSEIPESVMKEVYRYATLKTPKK